MSNMKKYENIKTTNNEKKNNKTWLLLLLLLLFLCLFGYLVFKIGFSVGEKHKPVTVDPTPQKLLIKISDLEGEWRNGPANNDINVFSVTTSAHKYIAPYDKGVYEFDVKNNISKNITYKLSLEENNEDRVNIKYKLKKNGKYIIDNWVYYEQVLLENVPLASRQTDIYELEWCWVSENNELDTEIGLKEERSEYAVTIKVLAVQDVER